MGQMVCAVMLGVETPPLPKGLLWWDDYEGGKRIPGILEGFKPGRGPEPEMSEESEVVGFFVAGDDEDTPDIDGAIALDRFEQTKPYARHCERARKQWVRLAAFCKSKGVNLGEPRLWLVRTEIA